jgi:hypothetical protein
VAELAEPVQAVAGELIEVAFAGQSYTGQLAASAAVDRDVLGSRKAFGS